MRLVHDVFAEPAGLRGRNDSGWPAGIHVSHILAKLGVYSRVEAAAIAHRTAAPR